MDLQVNTTTTTASENGRSPREIRIFNYAVVKHIVHVCLFVLVTLYTGYVMVWGGDNIPADSKKTIYFVYAILVAYTINRISLYKRTLFILVDWMVDVFQETIYRNIVIAAVSICQLGFVAFLCWQNIDRLYAFVTAIGLIVVSLMLNAQRIKSMPWSVILRSLNLHFNLAIVMFYWPWGRRCIIEFGNMIVSYLKFSEIGARFVYGNMLVDQFVFAFYVLSAIYLSFMTIAILSHLGFIDYLKTLSLKLTFMIGITPIEGVFGLVNTCLSMTETCVVVRKNLERMTRSELFALMVTGMSTISFTALFGYVSLGADIDCLIISLIVSIPCSFAFSKMYATPPITTTSRYDQHILNPNINEICPSHDDENNDDAKKNLLDKCLDSMVDANFVIRVIIGNLIAIMSFITFVDKFVEIALCPFVDNMGLFKTLTLALSYIMPVMGINYTESYMLSEMFVKKILINEFVAFEILGKRFKEIASERAIIIANIMMCGFGNISAVGMLTSVIASLTDNKVRVTNIAFKSLYVACIVNIYCACIMSLLF